MIITEEHLLHAVYKRVPDAEKHAETGSHAGKGLAIRLHTGAGGIEETVIVTNRTNAGK
jgi:hypothetical protein